MKMEIPVVAPEDGTVASIDVAVGDAVESVSYTHLKQENWDLAIPILSPPMVWTGQMTAGAIGPRQKNWQGLCAIV